ncbi:unnamed protein product [Amoebophrya sp. A120]|nr:unnamed protein product [Amoebophrya sp. A120]|eukprot:GSA120T00003949001.1
MPAHLWSHMLDDVDFWSGFSGGGHAHAAASTTSSKLITSFSSAPTQATHDSSSHHPHDAGATQASAVGTSSSSSSSSSASSSSSSSTAPSSSAKVVEEQLPRHPEIRVDMLNNNNSQYYGDFMLGTPPQPFTAVMDTGSGLIWVPGKKCATDVCADHHQYDEAASSTKRVIPSEVGATTVIHYGTGSVHYQQSEDTLRLCDSKLNPNCRDLGKNALHIPAQTMGTSLTQTSEPFKWLPFDGIFGLAPSASKGSALHSIRKAKVLAHNMLGCYLSEDTHRTGSLSFGGIEPQYIAKGHPLYWHTTTHPKEWQVAIADVEVNGEKQHACDSYPNKECLAVVDTGSSLITGPAEEMDPLLQKMQLDTSCKRLDKMPTVNLLLKSDDGLIRYPLTPQEYTLADMNEQTEQPECELGFGSMDVPGKKWVLGDTFLRRYYSIYDDDKGRVGFVRSVHPGEVAAPEPTNLVVGAKEADAKAFPRVAVSSFFAAGCTGAAGGVATAASWLGLSGFVAATSEVKQPPHGVERKHRGSTSRNKSSPPYFGVQWCHEHFNHGDSGLVVRRSSVCMPGTLQHGAFF